MLARILGVASVVNSCPGLSCAPALLALADQREDARCHDDYRTEKKVFRFSLLYLFLHFGALLAEAGLRAFGLGGW